MELLTLSFVAIAGLIVGSFLNVLILRAHTGRTALGRSGCMSCGVQLTWRDLIPLWSFVVQKGRCRYCGCRISHQYWMVELGTAVLFVAVWIQGFDYVSTAFALALMALLVALTAYDIRHTIIPNTFVYTFAAVAFSAQLYHSVLASSALDVPVIIAVSALIITDGLLVALPLFLLWLISRGAWMGLGDAKLALGFGFLLGVYDGLMAVMLGFVFGAIVGVALLAVPEVIKRISLSSSDRRFTMKSELPFAPFLVLGFLAVFLLEVDMVALVQVLL